MKYTLLEYIHLGGYVMYILLFLNILGLSIIVCKFIQMFFEKRKVNRVLTDIISSSKKEYTHRPIKELEEDIYNKTSKYLMFTELGMNTIKIIATISPILGLLGTVIGVLQSFETIASIGMSQGASSFAKGISLALITTIGGLSVALPHLIAYNYLEGSFRKLEGKYETELTNRILSEKIS